MEIYTPRYAWLHTHILDLLICWVKIGLPNWVECQWWSTDKAPIPKLGLLWDRLEYQ